MPICIELGLFNKDEFFFYIMVRLVITRVTDADWDQLVEVQFKAFASEQFCQFVNGKDTPLNRERCKKKYTCHEPEFWGGALWLKVIDADEVPSSHAKSNGNGSVNGNGNGIGNSPTILGAALYRLNPNYSAEDLKRTDLEPESFKWLDDPEERRIAVTVIHDVMDRKMRFIKEPHIRKSRYLFIQKFCLTREYRTLDSLRFTRTPAQRDWWLSGKLGNPAIQATDAPPLG